MDREFDSPPSPPDYQRAPASRRSPFTVSTYGGRYRTRTYDPLRVNCKFNLFSIVFEAKLLFYAYLYFSLKNLFLSTSVEKH